MYEDKPSVLIAMEDLISKGKRYSPRDQLTIEIMNYQFEVDYPFSSFNARKLDMNYLKREFIWYLHADPFNDNILKASSNWSRFRQPEGNWFSCYGAYWFGPNQPGINWVVDQLIKDDNSRQAIIPMLQPIHLFNGNVDVVCTAYINFHIRDGRLNMTVRMRSSDIIWGYSNDLPCFWWLWEIVALILNIPKGIYTHSSDSLHVYEKHFSMIFDIINKGMDEFYTVNYPKITDVDDLINCKFESEFGKWLTEVKL